MIEYTRTHFITEEQMMKMYKYPDYDAHKREHVELTRKAIELEKQFRDGSLVVSFKVSRFLKEWLTSHILGCDQKYAPFFNAKGIR